MGRSRRIGSLLLTVLAVTLGMAGAASADGQLVAVACHRGMVCIAVGAYQSSHAAQYVPLVEHLGKDVVRQRVPVPRDSIGSQLGGISCPTRTTCVAVGFTTDPNGHEVPLVERWNGGSWSAETIRPFPGPGGTQLVSVSCPTADQCTAVGNTNGQPLVERWDGDSWSGQDLPLPPGASDPSLNRVSCSSAISCMAVGSSVDANHHRQPLAESWDGSAWSATPEPYFRSRPSEVLLDVACVSSQWCITVAGGIVQRWDGSTWSTQPGPHSHIHLRGVSCVSQSSCMAVGDYISDAVDRGTYAEVWKGHRWSTRRPVSPSSLESLTGVSCSAASRCAAVGSGETHRDVFAGLSEHWNGRGWGNVHWH